MPDSAKQDQPARNGTNRQGVIRALANGRIQRFAVPGALVILVVAMAIANPRFLSPANLANIGTSTAPIGIVAMGMCLLLISGNFDLSVGGIGALSAVTGAWFLNQFGLVAAIVLVLILAACYGAANAVIVIGMRVNSLIGTLGTGFILAGLAVVLSGSTPIQVMTDSLLVVMNGKLGPIPIPVLLFGAAIVLASLYSHTIGGRALYAVGANREAARYAGLDVRKVSVIPFIIVAVFAGWASLITLGYVNSGLPTIGANWPLQAIAAVVVGGVSISGGEGNVFGAVVGVLLIGVVQNGLVLSGINSNYQNIIIGLIIIAAVAADVRVRERGRQLRLRRSVAQDRPPV